MKTISKLNLSKALNCLKISLFSATLITSLAGNAGGGSGNGNGDDAFALQKVAKANPGLKPHEVLIKAFRESVGRPVDLKFETDNHRENYESANFLNSSTVRFYQFTNLNNTSQIERGESEFVVLRSSITNGPLLGEGHENGKLIIDRARIRDIENNALSTVVRFDQYQYTSTEADLQVLLKISIEYRQYNSKIIIFAMPPALGSDGKQYCLNSTGRNALPVPANGICSVGYMWKD